MLIIVILLLWSDYLIINLIGNKTNVKTVNINYIITMIWLLI
jgi:hypothetical protein